MKRFKPLELFEINQELTVKKIKIDDAIILIIDNFYKNPDRLRELILETPVPIWKNTHDSLNFKQYYDCRHDFGFYDELSCVHSLSSIISHYYEFIYDRSKDVRFLTNTFQWIEDQPFNVVGNKVHTDDLNTMAVSVFFNKEDELNGGTAIYRSKHTGHTSLLPEEEFIGPIEDGQCYYDNQWEDNFLLEHVVSMQYNRCIVHPGRLYHGAYHIDNSFKDFPRISQITFIPSEFHTSLKKEYDQNRLDTD